MVMTHYMELLSMSPYHLILLMVVPMALAELLVATEIFSLINRNNPSSKWHTAKRHTARLLAVYYTALVVFVVVKVLPTITEWRGWADQIAIYSLLIAVLPLWVLLWQSFKKPANEAEQNTGIRKHAVVLVIYLVVGHLAMIFGMADPLHTGYTAPAAAMHMHHEGMNMDMQHGDMPMDMNHDMKHDDMPMDMHHDMKHDDMPMDMHHDMNHEHMDMNHSASQPMHHDMK